MIERIIVVSDAAHDMATETAAYAFCLSMPPEDIVFTAPFKKYPADIGAAEAQAVLNALLWLSKKLKGKDCKYINIFCDNIEVVNHFKYSKGKNWDIIYPALEYFNAKHDAVVTMAHISRTSDSIVGRLHQLCDYRAKETLYCFANKTKQLKRLVSKKKKRKFIQH